MNTEYKPMLKDWAICLYKDMSDEENEAIMEVVADSYQKTRMDSVQIPGPCVLSGVVYGRDGFNDGDVINTSNIESIERVERHNKASTPHDLMCATTKSGSKYYFYTDECNANMMLVLGDMIHTGRLDHVLYVTTIKYMGSAYVF